MAIAFNDIPVNLRTPGHFVEIDNSAAIRGLVGQPFKTLMIGQESVGSVAVDTLVRVNNESDAAGFFGEGSMLHSMARSYFAQQRSVELWAVALLDDGGAVDATGTFTFGGAATEAGTVVLYIAGRRITVAVASGDASTVVAVSADAAIALNTDLPASSGVATSVVTMTANHGGEAGNSIDLKHSYNQGEVLPAGITLAIVPMASGSANPVITPALTAIADSWFNVVAMPYTDAANLTLLEAELDARWGPLVAMEGVAFAGMDDTHANLLTFGDTRNSEFVSVLGTNDSPTPPWEWAAALAGVVSKQAQIDPARPFQTLELKSVLAPIDSDRFNQSERNLLLLDGIATSTADRDGTVRIERLITTYQTNAGGLPDISFLDANTLFTLGFLRFSLRARFFQKYPRHKLADDGTRVGAGQAVLTPTGAKSEVLSLFRLWEDAGLVEGITQFKDEIIIERNANDPTRLDFRLPPDLVNQLRVTATQIQFLL